jgi:hypothetical protein
MQDDQALQSTAENDTRLTSALELERITFTQALTEAVAVAEQESKAAQVEMFKKGLNNSGGRIHREIDIRFGVVEKVAAAALEKRRELGRRVPTLLSSPHLNQLKERLNRHVDGMLVAIPDRIKAAGQPLVPGMEQAVVRSAQQKASALQSKIHNELEALRLEAKLGMHEQEKPMTFNISNSTIASLNLGIVLGDLNASVQTLTNHGEADLAQSIKTLAEAVATSAEVTEATRKDLLEHLALVSGEAALPPEKRKNGPLKMSIGALKTGLAGAATLVELWSKIEHLLTAMHILH